MNNRIVIVGGGYIGAELAKALDDMADVVLVEQNSHFVHAPAMIRAVVDPALLDRALIPYDGLLKHGRIIQDKAQNVSDTGVTLASGEEIPADYIVVATGSNNAVPFKSNGADIEALRAANAQVHTLLNAANTVAIVGAGAVGTELAGEIAYAHPDKKVHLISSEIQLFANFPAKLGRQLAEKLEQAGVDIILGARAQNLESLTEPYSGTLTLSTGQSLAADLIFPVIGSKAASTLMETLPGVNIGTGNRAKTDHWMRPSSYANVFAAGDVAEMGDAMTIVGAGRQLAWLKKTLVALAGGQKLEQLKPYTPHKKAPILVPLGPEKGNSFLSLFVAGNFLTSRLKGKDLFLTKYNKLLGRD